MHESTTKRFLGVASPSSDGVMTPRINFFLSAFLRVVGVPGPFVGLTTILLDGLPLSVIGSQRPVHPLAGVSLYPIIEKTCIRTYWMVFQTTLFLAYPVLWIFSPCKVADGAPGLYACTRVLCYWIPGIILLHAARTSIRRLDSFTKTATRMCQQLDVKELESIEARGQDLRSGPLLSTANLTSMGPWSARGFLQDTLALRMQQMMEDLSTPVELHQSIMKKGFKMREYRLCSTLGTPFFFTCKEEGPKGAHLVTRRVPFRYRPYSRVPAGFSYTPLRLFRSLCRTGRVWRAIIWSREEKVLNQGTYEEWQQRVRAAEAARVWRCIVKIRAESDPECAQRLKIPWLPRDSRLHDKLDMARGIIDRIPLSALLSLRRGVSCSSTRSPAESATAGVFKSVRHEEYYRTYRISWVRLQKLIVKPVGTFWGRNEIVCSNQDENLQELQANLRRVRSLQVGNLPAASSKGTRELEPLLNPYQSFLRDKGEAVFLPTISDSLSIYTSSVEDISTALLDGAIVNKFSEILVRKALTCHDVEEDSGRRFVVEPAYSLRKVLRALGGVHDECPRLVFAGLVGLQGIILLYLNKPVSEKEILDRLRASLADRSVSGSYLQRCYNRFLERGYQGRLQGLAVESAARVRLRVPLGIAALIALSPLLAVVLGSSALGGIATVAAMVSLNLSLFCLSTGKARRRSLLIIPGAIAAGFLIEGVMTDAYSILVVGSHTPSPLGRRILFSCLLRSDMGRQDGTREALARQVMITEAGGHPDLLAITES